MRREDAGGRYHSLTVNILEEPSAAQVPRRVNDHLTTRRGNLANRLGHRNICPRPIAERLTPRPPASTRARSPTTAYSPIRYPSQVQTYSVGGDVPYNAYLVRRLPEPRNLSVYPLFTPPAPLPPTATVHAPSRNARKRRGSNLVLYYYKRILLYMALIIFVWIFVFIMMHHLTSVWALMCGTS